MRIIRAVCIVATLLGSLSMSADGLVKLKDWGSSPQGYFMTKAERQQWSAIRSDEEAQRFIDHFLSIRDAGFAADVASRADQADKHLTIGKLPASKTLRGKVVILLGAPSSYDVAQLTNRSAVHHDSPVMAAALSGGSATSVGDDESNEGSRTMGTSSITNQYHFGYASTPAGPIDVFILADPNTGKDQAKSREDSKKLDGAFEAAAQASIKSK